MNLVNKFLSLISFVLLPLIILTILGEKCPIPKEFVQVHETSKFLFVDKNLKWENARDFCRKHSFELAKIRNMQEQYVLELFVNTHIKNLNKEKPQDTFWFGASDYKSEGIFHWTTGEDIQFQKFWLHNPNNDKKYTFGKYGEHCVELVYFSNTSECWWNDQSCSQKKPFFCEFPETKFQCYSPPAAAGFVDSPDLKMIKGTKIYNSGSLQLNWADAYSYCEDQGLNLISVTDPAAVIQISEVLKQDEKLFTHYWTSGTFFPQCCEKDPQYVMLNWQTMGVDAEYKNETFITWWNKEPLDQGGIHQENCVEILHLGNGSLDFAASHCSLPFQFLCSEPPGWKEVAAPPELGLSFTISLTKYFYSDRQYSWSDAYINCKAIGMELVSIETKEENRDLHKALTESLGLTTCWIWTSGTNLGSGNNEYTWLSTGEKMSYFNWQKGFEITTTESSNETQCVHVIVHGDDGTWNHFPCDATGNYVCEQRNC